MQVVTILIFGAFVISSSFAGDNVELQKITDADQADRRGGPAGVDWSVVRLRDIEREKAVLEIIRAGCVTTSTDYCNAALVYQHADSADDIALAYSLATVATRLEPEHPSACWLAAAAWDRLMMRMKKPQWYGTQFVKSPDGKWEVYKIDEAAVSDEE